MEKKKYSIWFYVVLVVIPFLMILLLELSLRVINYGDDYSTFVEIEEISPGDYFLNPDLPKKYFSGTTAIPSVIPDPFTKEKSENTIRIFVFGGSTTAGYPYPTNASFPRQIKRKLEMFYPKNKIEVVNLGVSAVNSYFIYDILPDVIQQKPDLIILYAGHNEFYGALGPASSENISASPGIVKTILYLREFKTYQLVYNFVKSISGLFSGGEDVTRGTLMKQMIKDQEILLNSELYNDGLIQFRENISETISLCNDENIPVIVGELVSNLKQKPLSRTHHGALKLFEDANEILQEGDTSRALVLFEEAKDKDQLRFRAPEDFNKILYELEPSHNLKLVKIKKGFESNSSDKITGYDLMVDHLHPNLDGYKLMADLFYEAVDELLKVRFDKNEKVSEHAIDNYLSDNFPFTRYDSTLANIKIEIL
ncbi:MAG: GDSL-type esterase/lipase family protein [Melioribacteraceae bacterium]|nr:GDSL-type esterase/lipase family protein [Melioribacteraceae bacterium]